MRWYPVEKNGWNWHSLWKWIMFVSFDTHLVLRLSVKLLQNEKNSIHQHAKSLQQNNQFIAPFGCIMRNALRKGACKAVVSWSSVRNNEIPSTNYTQPNTVYWDQSCQNYIDLSTAPSHCWIRCDLFGWLRLKNMCIAHWHSLKFTELGCTP